MNEGTVTNHTAYAQLCELSLRLALADPDCKFSENAAGAIREVIAYSPEDLYNETVPEVERLIDTVNAAEMIAMVLSLKDLP